MMLGALSFDPCGLKSGTSRPKRNKSLSDEFEKPIGIEALFRKGNHFFGFAKNILILFFRDGEGS